MMTVWTGNGCARPFTRAYRGARYGAALVFRDVLPRLNSPMA